MLKVFGQQSLQSLSAMHRPELNRVDPKDVQQLRRRFEYLLDDDRAARIHLLHHGERQEMDQQRLASDLRLLHLQVRQSEAPK
jgi:hypothetical protein